MSSAARDLTRVTEPDAGAGHPATLNLNVERPVDPCDRGRVTRLPILVLLVACGDPKPLPPTPPTPRPPPQTTPPPTIAPAPPDLPSCVTLNAPIVSARITDATLDACFLEPSPTGASGGEVDACWRFDLGASAWAPISRKPHADVAGPTPSVTATATAVSACASDGECKIIPIAGVTGDPLAAAANADRSLVAVWAGTGSVFVFDGAGKKLAAVKPWPTAMSNNKEPSVFRSAHVLGDVLEVRIADTPITSAIRLFAARTGRKIADVAGGKPMDDATEPVELGPNRYGFVTFEDKTLVVVETPSGKQVASVALHAADSPSLLARAGDGAAVALVGATVVRIDLTRQDTKRFAAPACAQ